MGSRSDMREEGEMQTSPGGVETKVRPKKLGHVVLRVRNVERSERFYAEVCEGCSAREICPGTTPTYAEYYTVDELVAL